RAPPPLRMAIAACYRDRRASAPTHLVPWEPHWRLLSVSEQGPRTVVDITGFQAGHGNVDGMPRAERVDTTFPRLALNGRGTAHLAERGRQLLERPQELDKGTWAADVVPRETPPSR